MPSVNRISRAPNLIGSVSEIVSAYISNNHVASAELPALLANVHAELSRISDPKFRSNNEITQKLSASEIRDSISRDGIKSFLDGRIYKTLKRHLSRHGLTPATYRQRFGLPFDYPMTAPAYSERRTAISKAIVQVRSRTAELAH
ncbi:MucR family transcriptional regulator [Methylobacterium sp. E-065]|uniref:MucR family transcriptional regulator n=1 Tax=Methylobacterium sp. E-065 TaxID=2836583 RepID=UPI001FBB1A58|nr:MucR family transcriptional regulator [Methylobacterium sp. E-065]MCJ2019957.1 MucR family transcriptional regulator [Methylobacterium sp. E-065]